MEEDSPWGDVPSRSQSSSNLAQQGEDEAAPNASRPATSESHENENERPTSSTAVKSPVNRSRPTRKFGAQSTTLEALDDSLGPLGPLGDDFGAAPAAEEAPAPPQKEQTSRNVAAAVSGTSSLRGMMESVDLAAEEEDVSGTGFVKPRPIPPPNNDAPKRSNHPSVSIEQAAKPTFDISVGDPHKVGDLTGSHTVYQVFTKTTSKAYRNPEMTVSRRYRDFLWLYNQLHNNNPGVVVPPPPEKQAVGRFDQSFVETRRAALERMLNKATSHPVLQHDGDLKLFLESDAFNVDIKHKERKDVGLPEAKTGMFGGMLSVGSGTKFVEHDDWFHDRKIYLDALENQLKALLKSTDTVVLQRKALSDSCNDLSLSLHALALVELSPSLSAPLEGLSDIQMRIKELYDRQAQQDVLTLGIVIDEYIRLIGSIKTAFQQRQKAYHAWHASESALAKLKNTQEKLLRAGRTQQDRLSQMQADVGDAERRVHQSRLLFEDMGRLMRSELERFEKEKVEDFKSGVETFLESAVEAQKELIELWETYLLQLDAEDDASFLPAGITVDPSAEQSSEQAPNENEARTSEDDAATETFPSSDDGAAASEASLSHAGAATAAATDDEEA